MSKILNRLLKIAETMYDSGEDVSKICHNIDAFIKKHGHYVPENNGKVPNPLRRNMDYAPWEHSPYFGSMTEFMEKFPGGIKDWLKWRKETESDRYNMFSNASEEFEPTEKDIEEAEEELNNITPEERKTAEKLLERMLELGLITKDEAKDYMKNKAIELMQKQHDKKAHYIPEGKDDVPNLGENEQPLYSDHGLEKFKSIKEFLKNYRKEGHSADDAALRAVKDMVDYWKLLLKGKKRRGKK